MTDIISAQVPGLRGPKGDGGTNGTNGTNGADGLMAPAAAPDLAAGTSNAVSVTPAGVTTLGLTPAAGFEAAGMLDGAITDADDLIWGAFEDGLSDKTGPIAAQGRAQKMRTMMTRARHNNAILNATLMGATPRAASTAYTLGQQISNGGRVYEVTTAGTTGSGSGPTSRGYGIADGSAVLDYVGAQTAPALTNLAALPADLTQSIPASTTSTVLRFGGGIPMAWPGGGVGCWAIDSGVTGTGNIQNGDSATVHGLTIFSHFMELRTDSPRVCLAIGKSTSIAFNVLVSDESGTVSHGFRYVLPQSIYPSAGASGTSYVLLDFSGLAGAGKMRRIRIETGGLAFLGAYLLPTATAAPVGASERLRGLFIGDSWIAANTFTPIGNRKGPGEVLGHLLGVDEIIASGAPSTGYTQTTAGCPRTFQDRCTDLLSLKPDFIAFLGSVNDPYNTAALQAAVLNCITKIRAVLPVTPIIFFGMNLSSSGNNVSLGLPSEAAIAAGIAASGDPSTYFVPTIGATGGAWILGNGNASAPNASGNADVYVGPAAHLNELGNIYFGSRMAGGLRQIIQSAAWRA